MRKQPFLLGSFSLFFFLGVILFFLFRLPIFSPVQGFFETIFLPVERLLYTSNVSKISEVERLKEENAKLLAQLAKDKQSEKEMAALKDQFAFSQASSRTLLPAHIIGKRDIDTFILDKGENDGVKKGMIVVVKDILVGTIAQVTPHTGVLLTMSNKAQTISAKTSGTGALGILKGTGGAHLLLDHVVLSDHLDEKDVVLTKGDADKQIPADLSIGKISSVDKKMSDVFQEAQVDPLLDISHISLVFISLP
jgi:rod shape-determining protein MreC